MHTNTEARLSNLLALIFAANALPLHTLSQSQFLTSHKNQCFLRNMWPSKFETSILENKRFSSLHFLFSFPVSDGGSRNAMNDRCAHNLAGKSCCTVGHRPQTRNSCKRNKSYWQVGILLKNLLNAENEDHPS